MIEDIFKDLTRAIDKLSSEIQALRASNGDTSTPIVKSSVTKEVKKDESLEAKYTEESKQDLIKSVMTVSQEILKNGTYIFEGQTVDRAMLTSKIKSYGVDGLSKLNISQLNELYTFLLNLKPKSTEEE